MEILNQYSNALMAIMSTLLVIITLLYVAFTWRMVKEMQITREADLRPYIIIDILLADQKFHLLVKNIGKTVAESVTFNIDKNIENMWKNTIGEMPLFKEGVAFFPPGREFVVTLGPTWLFLNKKEEIKYPLIFTIVVKYKYFGNISKSEPTTINLDEYMNTMSFPDSFAKSIVNIGASISNGLNSIAKNTEKISKIEEISSPTGIDVSQGTLFRLADILRENSKHKIKFDLNLTTLMELVELLGVDLKFAEKIIMRRYSDGYFRSFDDLKNIEGITDELIDNLKKRTFICTPKF
ncbi:MAG TPA: helix-hairpin-helix domain-containing protein [Paludibacteraceae bacterium]|nr:helix-hairpin-helix domain-containing protein [Paludibacteraceae bacterium]HPD49699.1 helix-hairpin-helix domain-containing protein [Smithellaceae bacterium]